MRTKRSAKIWACSCGGFSIRITSDDSCTASAGKTLSVRPSVWQDCESGASQKQSATHKSNDNVASSKRCRILQDDRLGFTSKESGTDPYVVGIARLVHKIFVSPPGIGKLGELSWEVETVGLGPLVVEKISRPDQEETRVTKAIGLVSIKHN